MTKLPLMNRPLIGGDEHTNTHIGFECSDEIGLLDREYGQGGRFAFRTLETAQGLVNCIAESAEFLQNHF